MKHDSQLMTKLASVAADYESIAEQMADPEVAGDPARYRELATRYSELEPIAQSYKTMRKQRDELDQAQQMAAEETDPELKEMAEAEAEELQQAIEKLEADIKVLLLPKDPNDDKNVVIEVRAGTGGDEATLFAAELFRMYERYAESQSWKTTVVSMSESEVGGVKEMIAEITGTDVYARLKFESGVHRVQRVPSTESQGRVHTSAATVAILPEAEDIEIEIDEDKELRIDFFSASGPGGQHVNKTASAVRLTHLPTNIVVSCQDQKSQHKNKAKAMKVLRARLFDRHQREQHEKEASARRGQIGSGDRSEKIRTYNFPQSRVTDHRIHLTLHKLESILQGDMDEMIDALRAADTAERLQAEVGEA